MEKWPIIKSFLPLLYLVVVAACIFIYITHYPPQIAPESYTPQDRLAQKNLMDIVRYGYPLVAGVLIVYIITNPFSLLKHVRDLRRLNTGRRGQPPQDGSVIAVTGQIMADHKPVTTPVGRTSCIAYYYHINRVLDRRLDYFGYAFTPSSINASFGKVRILAVPHIDFFSRPETEYTDSNAQNNFKTYFHSARFVKSLIGCPPLTKEKNISMADRMSPVSRDVKMLLGDSDPDLDGFGIYEHCLDEGEIVCAFGMYSASQKGLVHDPESGELFSIQIKRGPITKIIKEQKTSIVRNLVGTTCSLAILTAMVWAYQNLYDIYTIFNLANM